MTSPGNIPAQPAEEARSRCLSVTPQVRAEQSPDILPGADPRARGEAVQMLARRVQSLEASLHEANGAFDRYLSALARCAERLCGTCSPTDITGTLAELQRETRVMRETSKALREEATGILAATDGAAESRAAPAASPGSGNAGKTMDRALEDLMATCMEAVRTSRCA